jgi:hypothetical protein
MKNLGNKKLRFNKMAVSKLEQTALKAGNITIETGRYLCGDTVYRTFCYGAQQCQKWPEY